MSRAGDDKALGPVESQGRLVEKLPQPDLNGALRSEVVALERDDVLREVLRRRKGLGGGREEEISQQHAPDVPAGRWEGSAVGSDSRLEFSEAAHSVALSVDLPGLLHSQLGEAAEEASTHQAVLRPVCLEEERFADRERAKGPS